jgi:hypothetical protein
MASWATSCLKIGASYSGIGSWFGKMAAYIRRVHRGQQLHPLRRHHMYWAGYAIGQLSAVNNDQSMYDFAMDILTNGLATVAVNGSLPSEMWRADRSLMYQNFATLPLAGLIALGAANGRVFTDAEKAAITRLVVFSYTQSKDPSIVAAIANTSPLTPMFGPSDVAWVDVILPTLKAIHPQLAKCD